MTPEGIDRHIELLLDSTLDRAEQLGLNEVQLQQIERIGLSAAEFAKRIAFRPDMASAFEADYRAVLDLAGRAIAAAALCFLREAAVEPYELAQWADDGGPAAD